MENKMLWEYIEDLEKAKKNVITLIDEPNASIDMHGI